MSKDTNSDIKKDSIALEDELRVYELGYHVLPTVSEENLEKEVATLKSAIEKNGGLFIGEEGIPRILKLAYEMIKVISNKKTKFSSAYFGWVKFEANAESILKINNELKSVDSLLRFLLIKSVRESKMIVARKRPVLSDTPKATGAKKDEPISEVEVDKAIEELIVE